MKNTGLISIAVVIVVIAAVAVYVGTQPAAPVTTTPKPTSTTTSAPTTTTTTTKPFKMALLIPGTMADPTFNLSAIIAAQELQREMAGLTINLTEGLANMTDYERVAREYASSGYDLIMSHGSQYTTTALKIAPDYPKVMFSIQALKAEAELPANVGALWYYGNEISFLGGVVAGLSTQANKIGLIAGIKIPSLNEYVNGYALGIKYINPNAEISFILVGDLNDPIKAKEAASSIIGMGVDVIAMVQNMGSYGVIDAAKPKNVKLIASIGDLYNFAPAIILTSAYSNHKEIFRTAINAVNAGTFGKHQFTGTLKNGLSYLAPFRGGNVTQSVQDKVNSMKQDIIDGKLIVPDLTTDIFVDNIQAYVKDVVKK